MAQGNGIFKLFHASAGGPWTASLLEVPLVVGETLPGQGRCYQGVTSRTNKTESRRKLAYLRGKLGF